MRVIRLAVIFILFSFLTKAWGQGSGNVLSFNGWGTYVDLGTNVAAGTRTIEMWFNPSIQITSNINDAIALVIRDYNNGNGYLNEFGLYFTPQGWAGMNGGALVFYRNLGSTIVGIQSNNTLWQANVWYHVSAVIDPVSGMKMYINGELQADTDPSTQVIPAQTGSVTDMVAIGAWGYPLVRHFDGDIDEVRFWTTARTQTEVRNKMCSKLAGNETGLRAYYRFDNTSGGILTDATGNGYNGTMYGFASNPWHYSSAPIGDTSTYVYPVSNFQLAYQAGDTFSVSGITGNSGGAHIYRVNSNPNSLQGLNNNFSSYYGAFLTGTTGNYNIHYNYSAMGNCSCKSLYSRNDNAVMPWSLVNGSVVSGCSISKANESTQGESYREEYIVAASAVGVGGLGSDINACSGDTVHITLQNPGTNIQWSTGDSSTMISVTGSGSYWVHYLLGGCPYSDTIQVTINQTPVPQIGNDTSVCAGTVLNLSAHVAPATYTWSTGAHSQSIAVSASGTYWVEAANNGCEASDTVVVVYKPYPSIFIGNDTTLCGQNLVLHASANGSVVNWSGGTTADSLLINSSGTYWANTSLNGCASSDTIHVNINPYPVPNAGNDTAVCSGVSVTLNAGTTASSFTWSTGANTQSISVTTPGIYWVDVTTNGCSKRDTVQVINKPVPTLSVSNDTILCGATNYVVQAFSNGGIVTWAGGMVSNSLTVTSDGTYVAVDNWNGCTARDSVHVVFSALPQVDLGPDSAFCKTAFALDAGNPGMTYLWNSGATTHSIAPLVSGTYWVVVTNSVGCTASDSITLLINPDCDVEFELPNVFTPNNDFTNEAFIPVISKNIKEMYVVIYNRWGQKLYESSEVHFAWDGKYNGNDCADGTYYYLANYTDIYGKKASFKGYILLVR